MKPVAFIFTQNSRFISGIYTENQYTALKKNSKMYEVIFITENNLYIRTKLTLKPIHLSCLGYSLLIQLWKNWEANRKQNMIQKVRSRQ